MSAVEAREKAGGGSVSPPPGGPIDTSLLARGRVIIVGLGGIGSILAVYLCLFLSSLRGIRVRLLLVDGDAFEERNRERMEVEELENKAVVLCRVLTRRFGRPGLLIRPVDRFLSPENIEGLVAEDDLVFSCVDNHSTRKLLSDRCEGLREIVLISGGNDGVEGGLIYYLRDFSPAAKISEVVQRSEARCQRSGRFFKRPLRAAA